MVSGVLPFAERCAYSGRVLKRKPTRVGESHVTPTGAELLVRADIDALLARHRAAFGGLRMDGEGGGGEGGGGGQGGAGGGGNDPARFTQEDMNATVAREVEKAKNAALQQVATDLGVSLEEAKQVIADRKAADDAKRTEAERAAEAWKTAQQGAEAIKAEADRERHEAKVERALQSAGLDVTNETILAAGLAAIGKQVQVGADADAIKAAVDKAKKDAPQLFGTPSGGGGGRHTDPGTQRRDTTAPNGEFGAGGAEMAKRRFGDKTKETAGASA